MNVTTRDKLTNLEVIMEYFEGKREESELTEKQIDYLRAVRTAYGLLLDLRGTKYIIGTLIKTFDVSQATAYRLLADTQTIFGKVHQVQKEIARHQAIEMARKTYERASLRNDVKGMAMATKAFIEATGISLTDPDLPDFQKLQPSLVITVLPEGMEDDIRRMLGTGAVNLNTIPKDAETIPFEEIKDDAERADQPGDRPATREGQ